MRTERLSLRDLEQWVQNDEGLYRRWRSSRLSLRKFISTNRDELRRSVMSVLNRPPRS